MLKPNAVFLWRKVDNPSHDSCCLFKLADGWRLAGASVFCDEGQPCRFNDEVSTDAAWKTQSANVSGFLGKKGIDVRVRSTGAGRWKVNGV